MDYHTIIVGSGAAGLACAYQLVKQGLEPQQIAIITNNLGGGTSFNTGSDKQTYYKLSTVGEMKESPKQMAEALFDGGCMHGDIALVEATCSIQTFMNLVQIGVPFPHDKYGAYIGYKTDNDPLQRGTSIGPLTSQKMAKCFLNEIKKMGVAIIDQHLVIRILKDSHTNQAVGVSALDKDTFLKKNIRKLEDFTQSLRIFTSQFVVLATGGPSGMYKYSVYPEQHWGGSSLAIDVNAEMRNLTESQYGLASIQYRWNVSGSYQQVIPRYISIPKEQDISQMDLNELQKYEFLEQYFPSVSELTKAIFLKGYQWPFNAQRIAHHGSSLIDLAVHIETVLKDQKVYMDFRQNPKNFSFEQLKPEPREYLENSGALQDTPIERLAHMNPKAIQLYKSHDIDLWNDPLEIAVCAQHCNGGVAGDIWWQTSIPRLFAIGEVNGSHGVHRPGGAALNSGQVGALRAAEKIVNGNWDELKISNGRWEEIKQSNIENIVDTMGKLFKKQESQNQTQPQVNIDKLLERIQSRMMESGAYIRKLEGIREIKENIQNDYQELFRNIRIRQSSDFLKVWRVYEAIVCQAAHIHSIETYLKKGGGSRGSFLVIEDENGTLLHPKLENFKAKPENEKLKTQIQKIRRKEDLSELEFETSWVSRKKIPDQKAWFETTWAQFDNKEIFQNQNK